MIFTAIDVHQIISKKKAKRRELQIAHSEKQPSIELRELGKDSSAAASSGTEAIDFDPENAITESRTERAFSVA